MTGVARTVPTDDATGWSDDGPPPERARQVRRRLRYTLPGLVGALVFVCLSLSPSLLPRTGVIQGLVCGITGAIGYGVGVLVAWMWRGGAGAWRGGGGRSPIGRRGPPAAAPGRSSPSSPWCASSAPWRSVATGR